MASNGGLSGKRWDEVRRFVIARDSACHLCGKPVDKTLSGRHPRGPQAHHLLPKKRYPAKMFDPSVIRLTHRDCNERAGDRMPEPSINGEPSRQWLNPGAA